MPDAKDPVLAEAERDVRELEQYVADQHIRRVAVLGRADADALC